MRENVRNFLIGLAAIVSISGLAALLFLLGELDRFVHPRYPITLRTSHALGLRPGSRVELSGVPIGVVDAVYIESNRTFPVRLRLLINADHRIPESAVPFSEMSILGASATLTLEPPPLTADVTGIAYLPRDGTAQIECPLRFRTVEQITAELDARIQPFQEQFAELSATYTALGHNLNELIAPVTPDTADGAQRSSLPDTVANLNHTLDEVQAAMSLAQEWLGDEQLREGAQEASSKLNALIDESRTLVARLGALADAVEGDAQTVTQRLLPVADELSALIADVRQVSRQVLDGQGTAAQMLNNPDLYNALNDSATQLERTLQEMDLLIEKLRAEGVKVDL